MIVIGITGGIGSGKSTLSDSLRRRGYPILDADAQARAMTAPGGAAIPEIRSSFGPDYIRPDGSLDRKKMAELVFRDPAKKVELERIIVRKVQADTRRQIAEYRQTERYDILFVDAPTLFETGGDALVDAVWMVTAPEEIRIRRVMTRDGCTRGQVLDRIHAQMPEEEKIRRSDAVIENSGTLEALEKRIDCLLEQYGSETTRREENK